MDLTKEIGLWVHDPATIMGHLHEAKAMGFSYILPKILDGRKAYQPNITRGLLAAAASMGLPVIPWIYAYPGEAQAIAQAVENSLPRGCKDLIVDMEVEFETGATGAREAEDLLHAIAVATGHRVSLHLSSFWSPALHPKFPFAAAMKHCASWQPQAYVKPGGRTAQQILDGTLQQAAGIKTAAQPTVVTINDTSFLPLLKDKGLGGFSVWAWDGPEDAIVSENTMAWATALKGF